jgi:hypothetical protein
MLLTTPQSSYVRQSAERRLKRKIGTRIGQAINLVQNEPASGDCGKIGLKR